MVIAKSQYSCRYERYGVNIKAEANNSMLELGSILNAKQTSCAHLRKYVAIYIWGISLQVVPRDIVPYQS